jgi:hypothetical protein
VIAAAEDRASALAAGDAERLAGLLHKCFRWTSHTGESYSRSEYVRRNTKGHTVWRSQRLSGVEVVVVNDTAVLHAEVTDEVVGEGDELETFRMPMTRAGSARKATGCALRATRDLAVPDVPPCRCRGVQAQVVDPIWSSRWTSGPKLRNRSALIGLGRPMRRSHPDARRLV